MMFGAEATILLVFILASVAALLVLLAFRGGDDRLDERIRTYTGLAQPPEVPSDPDPSPWDGITEPLAIGDADRQSALRARLRLAGFHSAHAATFYVLAKLLLLLTPWLLGLGCGLGGLGPMEMTLAGGAFLGVVGILAPRFWLSSRIARRQGTLRAGLPDVLDVLVICQEAGASLPVGLQRVSQELSETYPELGAEMKLVWRDLRLGLSAGEGLQRFAERTELEEAFTLADVVRHAEDTGGGLAVALRTQAQVVRDKLLQQAEEAAGKAATKILFPTLLLIFPGLFVVLLGPAALQMREIMPHLNATGEVHSEDDAEKGPK